MVSNSFVIFTPGKWSNLTCAYFSNGLVQPPTIYFRWRVYILPKTRKLAFAKRKFIFQAQCFRCELLVSGYRYLCEISRGKNLINFPQVGRCSCPWHWVVTWHFGTRGQSWSFYWVTWHGWWDDRDSQFKILLKNGENRWKQTCGAEMLPWSSVDVWLGFKSAWSASDFSINRMFTCYITFFAYYKSIYKIL